MRELTVRIRFVRHCLANKMLRDGTGRMVFARSPSGHIVFLPAAHNYNLGLAAQLLGRHHRSVHQILWDVNIEGILREDPWFKAFYRHGNHVKYSVHEAFFPGEVVGINCAVPSSISQDDFWRLMSTAGKYVGLSPWKPQEYGFYEVVSIVPRQPPDLDEDTQAWAKKRGPRAK